MQEKKREKKIVTTSSDINKNTDNSEQMISQKNCAENGKVREKG